MDIAEITPGQTVHMPYDRGLAVVLHVGACHYPGCRFGDQCVEVRPVDQLGGGPMNYRAKQLEPVT